MNAKDTNDCVCLSEIARPFWLIKTGHSEVRFKNQEHSEEIIVEKNLCPECYDDDGNNVGSIRICPYIERQFNMINESILVDQNKNLPEIFTELREGNYNKNNLWFVPCIKENDSKFSMSITNIKKKYRIKKSNLKSLNLNSIRNVQVKNYNSKSYCLMNEGIQNNLETKDESNPLSNRLSDDSFKYSMRLLILVGMFVAGSTLAPLSIVLGLMRLERGIYQNVEVTQKEVTRYVRNSPEDICEAKSYYQTTEALQNDSTNQWNYVILHLPSSFDEAQTRCQEHGGHLIHVKNLRKQLLAEQMIVEFLSQNRDIINSGGFWIGARKPVWLKGLNHCVPGQWRWIDATNLSMGIVDGQTAFVPGKPDYKEDEECLYLTEREGLIENRYLKWDDMSCNGDFIRGFCEI